MASVDTDSGEFQEKRLVHREEAEKFYGDLAAQGLKVRVGMEAVGMAAGSRVCWPNCSLSCGLRCKRRLWRERGRQPDRC